MGLRNQNFKSASQGILIEVTYHVMLCLYISILALGYALDSGEALKVLTLGPPPDILVCWGQVVPGSLTPQVTRCAAEAEKQLTCSRMGTGGVWTHGTWLL